MIATVPQTAITLGVATASALAITLMTGCGGEGSSAGSPDSGSPYQTAQGFCADVPELTGGDLVGTWTVFAACGISTGSPANCAGATVSLSLAAHGTVTFNADQTGSIDVTVELHKQSSVAASCSSAGDCASLQSELAIEVGTGAGARAVCMTASADATRCTCEQTHATHDSGLREL